jgi:C-terminal processing protease CtpA/Prc
MLLKWSPVLLLILSTTSCHFADGFQTTVSLSHPSSSSIPSTRLKFRFGGIDFGDNIFGIRKTTTDDDIDEQTTVVVDAEEEDVDMPMFTVEKTVVFLKVAFPSFLAGGVVALGFLFLPLLSDYYDAYNYNSGGGAGSPTATGKTTTTNNNVVVQQNVNQPVILFETILNDLNDAYVDDVDVQKLFETGVKAMTSSLDPYTEFESRVDAQALEETVTGRYGGVGLVIRGGTNLRLLDDDDVVVGVAGGTEQQKKEGVNAKDGVVTPSLIPDTSVSPVAAKDGSGDDDMDADESERRRARKKSMEDGIRVVSAFEGYAYDAGMRVGDKLLAIDDFVIQPTTAVDEVRTHLRGEPGTPVSITFLRDGVGGEGKSAMNKPQTITLQRSVVRIPDVKYFGFIGEPSDGIGYIDLSGFANDAGREVRYAIKALQHGATQLAAGDDTIRDASGMVATDATKLKGLVLDLRSNPGGLLTSAVDVATLFVPNGSDIVSAKGRGFPEVLYRSKTEPALNPATRLAVLVNDQTASAAEIVSGAIQDLDVGVIVGKGRTFGKGLVQNVQDLPYQTALKYTVAKYYTPSGRCIQSTVYETDGDSGAKYKSKKVADKDRTIFYTAHGRQVKDGGGVEVDVKIEPQKASQLEVILVNSGTYSDYAAEWSKKHELTDNFKVDDATYKDFQRFVEKRQEQGDMKLEILYDSQLKELQQKLTLSKLGSSSRELAKLRANIIKDVKKDFTTYKAEIIEDIEQNILARYLPDSMLIERGLRSDVQVIETAKMLKDGREFNKVLARDNSIEKPSNDIIVASSSS